MIAWFRRTRPTPPPPPLPTSERVIAALSAAGYGLVADAKREALTDAAEALNLQPPKLKAQYVATIRLYAAEPWRLETKPRKASNDDQ